MDLFPQPSKKYQGQMDKIYELLHELKADQDEETPLGPEIAMKLDPTRVQILKEGQRLTSGDRDKEYGSPRNNLARSALLIEAYLIARSGKDLEITAEDVAWLMVLVKIARTFSGSTKLDTYIDAATYAAIAGEVTPKLTNTDQP